MFDTFDSFVCNSHHLLLDHYVQKCSGYDEESYIQICTMCTMYTTVNLEALNPHPTCVLVTASTHVKLICLLGYDWSWSHGLSKRLRNHLCTAHHPHATAGNHCCQHGFTVLDYDGLGLPSLGRTLCVLLGCFQEPATESYSTGNSDLHKRGGVAREWIHHVQSERALLPIQSCTKTTAHIYTRLRVP